MRESLSVAQGVCFLVTGAWPLVHDRSLQAVAGPKREPWLVKTVGVCVGAIGLTLLAAGRRKRVTPEVRRLGAASAIGLAGIELAYGLRGRIAQVYVAEAAVELALAGAWAFTRAGERPTDAALSARA